MGLQTIHRRLKQSRFSAWPPRPPVFRKTRWKQAERKISMARDKKRDRRVRISKYLSFHLRHQPEALGLELGPGGWVSVAALLAAAARNGFAISREELEEVVASSDKQRYSLNADRTQVRANQGHSVPI